MAATITVENLGASYDTLNKGTQLIITSSTDDIVSFTYMLTPGGNATGNAYDNSFITKTLLVGSDSAVKIGGTSPSFKYLLFIEEDETLCADDFYVIVSARNSSGASEYTEPETIYLTPVAPTVTGAVLNRTGSSGYEDGVLTVTLAADVTCGKTVDMYFVLQFQEVGQTGYAVERIEATQDLNDSLTYTANVDGLDQYGIVDDSLFVAVQAVRTIGSTEASSDLSNTVQATDSDQQLPPVNLRINYQPAEGDNGTTDVSFNNPPTYQVIEPASFNIYKQIQVYEGAELSANVIGTVDFDANKGLTGDYSFADVSANLYPDSMGAGNLPLNSVITYWATAVDGASESVPSNSESATVEVPSSAPTNLEGSALINSEGSPTTYSDGYTALTLSFTSPSDIEGETNDIYNAARYEVTVTSNDGLINYTSDRGDWFYADYPGSGVPITFNLPDGELSECTEGAELTVSVRLITSTGASDSHNDLEGRVAEITITAHTRPVITDINGIIGENDFTRANLQTFKVYYFGTLVPPGVSLLVENSSNQLQIVEGAFMQTQSGVVPDGYYRYAGAYERTYTIANSPAEGKDALLITACNASGFAQSHASLPIP
jgi:hypothetical protein